MEVGSAEAANQAFFLLQNTPCNVKCQKHL